MLTFNHILLAAAWLVYVFLHSLLASLRVKTFVERLMGTRHFKYYRLLYSIFASVTLIPILIFQLSMESILLVSPLLPVTFIGVLFSFLGLAVMGACIRKYFMNLSGVDVLIKECHTQVLEESGLHGYVRHPLYSGTLLFIWSMFILFPYLNNLIVCVIITAYTLIGIGMEENKLLIEYGESYKKYSSKIPMLIPSLTRLFRARIKY